MAKNLVIVESPTKSKSIGQYLGKDYEVLSSKGHIRDLATKGTYGFGVDLENHFKPEYVPIKGKKKVINDLKKEADKADHVYLATDLDREGEAIAWHLYDALGLSDDKYSRIVYNEISKEKVLDSFKHARKLDMDYVNSQEARRILDRIMGFRLSKLMQSKTGGKSAGRVQSVAVKLVVDREREIEAFIPDEYWTITADFNEFKADLETYNHKKIEIKNESEANEILNKLTKTFKIEDVTKKKKNKNSKAPYITSSMQGDAYNKLHFSLSKTMSLAQKLYEGIELEDGIVGLITYMRTDSIRIADAFVAETYEHIKNKYGEEYVGPVKKDNSKDKIQDAHEAIRPTSIKRTPESVKPYLSNDEFKLYRMIYYRALASLMAPAKVESTTVMLDNNNYGFKASGQIIVFDGYLKAYGDYEDTKDNILPPFDTYKSNVIVSREITKDQHFTQPPARYTEATLTDKLKALGIGRPSTFATIVSTIKERGYVNVVDRKFVPTDIAFEVTDSLQKYFSDLINVEYTANMESDLDKIADGDVVWYEFLDEFYKNFEPTVQNAFDKMPKKEAEETGEMCPECGNPLVIRKGKYGEFVACSNFPACKYIKQEPKEEMIICDCPNCDDGKIIEKRSRRGKVFYGCNNYPKCKTAYWDKPTGEKCPECGNMLTEKNGKIKCSSCDYKKED